jgi:hypothetical protein
MPASREREHSRSRGLARTGVILLSDLADRASAATDDPTFEPDPNGLKKKSRFQWHNFCLI